jgi:hypothetical protein
MGISRQPSPVQIIIYQKQPENVEYFNHFVSMETNAARCTREIKLRIAMAKGAFIKKNLFASKLDLHLRKESAKCYICNTALYDADTWTLREADQKHLESF